MRSSVLLPQPEGPTNERNSPSRTSQVHRAQHADTAAEEVLHLLQAHEDGVARRPGRNGAAIGGSMRPVLKIPSYSARPRR